MKEAGTQQMMLGNAAIARGAYEAGLRFLRHIRERQVRKSAKILLPIRMLFTLNGRLMKR